MSEFSIIYRMLRALRGALDSDEFPDELLSPDALGVSKPFWSGGILTGNQTQGA